MDATLSGVLKTSGDLRGKVPEIKITVARRAVEKPLTKNLMEYKTTIYTDGDKSLHNCTSTDDHETSIQHLLMQTKSVYSGMVGISARMS